MDQYACLRSTQLQLQKYYATDLKVPDTDPNQKALYKNRSTKPTSWTISIKIHLRLLAAVNTLQPSFPPPL